MLPMESATHCKVRQNGAPWTGDVLRMAISWRLSLGVALAGLALPCGPALAADSASVEGRAGTIAAPSPTEELFASPTTLDHIGRVVIPVMIDGRGPFRFVVDTGANHSTVSPALVQALGLKPSEQQAIMLDGITGSSRASAVTIDRLQAGALTLPTSSMPVVWSPVMAGADGILGTAALRRQSLAIDFEHNRVVISDRLASAIRLNSIRIHGTRLAYGLVSIDARVGGVRVHAIIDTGAERTLGNLALRNAVDGRRTRGVMARVTSVYGATTEVEVGEVGAAPLIALDSLRIVGTEIVYGDFHIFSVWGMEREPAMIIGMDVLGTVASLGIDFRNHDVYVGGARSTGDPFSTTRAYAAGRESR
jgi:predicted aspartyl protease